MSNIEVIDPTDARYEKVSQMADQHRRSTTPNYDYDQLAGVYNVALSGSILVVPEEAPPSRSNLAKILSRRGLVEGEDFLVSKPLRTAEGVRIPTEKRRLVIRKASGKDMQILNLSS